MRSFVCPSALACVPCLPEVSLSGHSAWIRFWCAAVSPAHQETSRGHWWAAYMPPATPHEAKVSGGRGAQRDSGEKERTNERSNTEVDASLHLKCVLSLGITGPLLMHVYFLQSQSGWRGSGNFNIHATTADPYTRNEATTNLGAESLFWKLFFNPPWVWFTAKGLLQPVTRQPAERTQTEKSIIDQQSNPLTCEKRLWQRELPGQKFKMLKGSFYVK